MIKYGILLSAAIFILSASASAGPNEALAFSIGQCAAQPDAKVRLACYDNVAAQLKAGSPAPTAAAATQAPPPVAQAQPPALQTPPAAPTSQSAQVASAPKGTWYDPTSWFGKETLQLTSKNPADFGGENIRQPGAEQASNEPLQQISAHVASASFNPFGRFTVTLDNGQVWRQLQADTGTARFSRKGGETVTISRGLLGSYNMTVEGTVQLFKVTRVQ